MKSSNIITMEMKGLFTNDKNIKNNNLYFQWKVRLIHIQGLTPKFPRSFVSREQLNTEVKK